MNKSTKSLLSSLEKTRHLFWNISKETGLFLNQIIRTNNIKNVLEIGTSNGYSGIWITEALAAKKGGHLYTIESHKKLRFNLATQNFAKAKLTPYITQILGHAPDVIPRSPKYFDLIFLDATKYEHTDYLKAILSRTKKGSIIITDNAISHKKELTPYFKAARRASVPSSPKTKSLKNFLLPIGSGLFISIKT